MPKTTATATYPITIDFIGAMGFSFTDLHAVALMLRGQHDHGPHHATGPKPTPAPHRSYLRIHDRYIREAANVDLRVFPRKTDESCLLIPLENLSATLPTVGKRAPNRIHFSCVRPLKGLVDDATVHPDVIDPLAHHAAVGARFVLKGGQLKALGCLDRSADDLIWDWIYKDGKKVVCQASSEGTDMVRYTGSLKSLDLNFRRVTGPGASPAPPPMIRFQNPKDIGADRIRATIFSLPEITIGARQSLHTIEPHFPLAYDVLKTPPLHRPYPVPQDSQAHDFITNCFKIFEV